MLKAFIVSDVSGLTWIREENSIEVSHISTTLVILVSLWCVPLGSIPLSF